MPTIKFHHPEDFTAAGPCPMGNGRKRASEEGKERERAMKRKQMGKGRGFMMGGGLPLTPIFAKRKKDGEIILQGL